MGMHRRRRLVAVFGAITMIVVMCGGPAGAAASSTGSNDASGSVGFGVGTYDRVGQTFTVPAVPATDNYLHSLTITNLQISGPSSHTVTVADTAGGLPGGTTTSVDLIPAAFGPASITVYPNTTLIVGHQYAFYIDIDGGTLAYSFEGSSSDAYAGGQVVRRTMSGGTWSAVPSQDIAFQADFNSGQKNALAGVSCPGPGKIGQPTACTATLNDAKSGTGLNTFSMALSSLLNPSGTFSSGCVVNAGSCSFNFTPLAAGSDTIFAQYVGGATYLGAGGSTPLSVSKRNSAQSAAACIPTTLRVGQTATCSVTVADSDTGTKTTPSGAASWSHSGTGTFSGGGSCDLSEQSLGVANCAAITYTPTAPGDHSVSSDYAGDGNHLASSTASAGTLTVLPAAKPPAPDCSGARAKISRLVRKLHKASGKKKKKKLKRQLKSARSKAAASGC